MKTKKKKIIAVAMFIVIGTIIFWKRDYIKQELGLKKPQVNDNNLPEATSKIDYKECTKLPYKLGCKGEIIKRIQRALNLKFESHLVVDGDLGEKTENALVKAGYGKTLEQFELNTLTNLN